MRRCLVVGNQTLQSSRLLRELRRHVAAGACEFHVLVPTANPNQHAFWAESEAPAVARDRLDAALDRLRAEGFAVTGTIGDADAVDAVSEWLSHDHADEVIVSTLPPGLSRWMQRDLPARLEHSTGLPVRHVITPFSDLTPSPSAVEAALR
jgi:hypothetical protein